MTRTCFVCCFRSAIANPESRSYNHMTSALFSQPVTPAFDFLYDTDIHKVTLVRKRDSSKF